MISANRRAENLQAIDWDGRDLLREIYHLREAIKRTIADNLHLADGDNCTLILLKRALDVQTKKNLGQNLGQRQ